MKKFFNTAKRRLTAGILTLVMVISMLPMTTMDAQAATVKVSTEDAINNASGGSTVQLTADIQVNKGIYIKDKSITIDLNGYKLYASSYTIAIQKVGSGTLTINDSTGKGTIQGVTTADYTINVSDSSGLVINGGTITGAIPISSGGTGGVTINGGTVTGGSQGRSAITVSAGNLTIKGGTLTASGNSPSVINFTSPGGTLTFDGGNIITNDYGYIGIVNDPGTTVNIKSGTVKSTYAIQNKGTLNVYGGTIDQTIDDRSGQYAIATYYNGAVTNVYGGTIIGDIYGNSYDTNYPNSTINIYENVVLNSRVYGTNITVSGATINKPVEGKDVTINNSTTNYILVPQYGNLNISNSTVGNSDLSNSYGILIYSFGVATISGCTIYGKNGIETYNDDTPTIYSSTIIGQEYGIKSGVPGGSIKIMDNAVIIKGNTYATNAFIDDSGCPEGKYITGGEKMDGSDAVYIPYISYYIFEEYHAGSSNCKYLSFGTAQTISSIAGNLTDLATPVAGAIAPTAYTLSGSPNFEASISWSDLSDGKYSSGKNIATITLKAKTGYWFSGFSDTSFKNKFINGSPAVSNATCGYQNFAEISFTVTYNLQPDLKGTPSIIGGSSASAGTQLAASTGTLEPTTNLTYTWYRSSDGTTLGTLIGTGTTYTPVAEDVGKYIILKVTSADAKGAQTAVTNLVASGKPQAALNITNPGTKTYGDRPFYLSTTGGSGSGKVTYAVTGTEGIVSITGNEVTILKSGTTTITATKAADGIYNPITATLVITIDKAKLTVTPKAGQSKYYGQTDPTLEYTVSGAVNNETPEFTGRLSRTAGEAISTYTYSIGSLALTSVSVNNNYTLVYSNPGNFTFAVNAFNPSDSATINGTSGSNGWYTSDVTINAPSGYQISTSNALTGNTWANSLTVTDGNYENYTYYLKNADGAISVAKTIDVKQDKVAPDATISIGTSTWKSFINTITFGLFFKNTQTVTIATSDTVSKVASTKYWLDTTGNSYSDSAALNAAAGSGWTDYSSSLNLTPNPKLVVYAKVTDNAGNVTYVNSAGLVVFEDSTAQTDSINYAHASGNDQTITLKLNGNTIKQMKNGSTVLTLGSDYTISGDVITVKASYLDTLVPGSYSLTITVYPQGSTATPQAGSDTPALVSIPLTVSKAVPTVSVTASPTGYQTRPNGITLSANLPSGATGKLQFKANGKDIGEPVDVGETVSFTASGPINDYTFTVVYSGDHNYSTATSLPLSYSFVKGEQAGLSFEEGIPEAMTYGHVDFDITATGGSGTGNVTYSVVSGPARITGSTVTLTGAGTVILRATKAADDDYNAKSVDLPITVSPRPVTIKGVTAQDKVYDGNTTADVSGTAVLEGKFDVDDVDIAFGTAAFADKKVGNGKTVTFTGFTLSGDDAGKYILTGQPANVTANITAKTIDINVNIKSKAYDGLNTAEIGSASLNGIVSNDVVDIVKPYPTVTFASVGVGDNIKVNFDSDFMLTGEDAGNYTLTQPTIVTGKITNSYNPVKGTDYTVNQNDWSRNDFVVTAKEGFELSTSNTADGVWSKTLTRSEETATGSITFYVRNKTTGAISLGVSEAYKIDKTAPTGDIKIGTNSIKRVLNAITFGLFFKETKSVEITADDTGSGVASVNYKLSSTILNEAAVEEISEWKAYNGTFTVKPDSKTVVYIKITDKVGNVTYVGSDGLVLFTDSTANTTEVGFTKTTTDDVTATVNLNGNTVKGISIDGNTIILNKDYTVNGGTITLKASYLDNLASGEYTLSVSFYPLGETGEPNAGSDTPASVSIPLKVSKANPALSVNVSPTGYQTRPNDITLSANLPSGATGKLQFKANGKDIGEPVDVGETVSFTASGPTNDYTFTVVYGGDHNYSTATSSPLSYSFVKGEQAGLSFEEGIPITMTYGDADFNITATGGSGTGKVTYSVVSGPAEVSGSTVTLTGAGLVILRATKAADDDYNAKSVDRTITVSPRPVTIKGVTAQDKVYDGNTTADVSGTAVLEGKLDGDNVDIVPGTAAFADKKVENGKTVTFTGFTLSGDDAGKYILTGRPANVTANITAKTIDMNVNIKSKAYDGLNTAEIGSASLNGIVSNDVVDIVTPYPTVTFASVGVGNNVKVDFDSDFMLTGEDAGNYTLTQPATVTGKITNSYNPANGTDYTVNQNDWSKNDFVVTAKEGFELSLTDTAGGVWRETLTKGEETANGSITFYVRNKTTGAISLGVSETYKIDKTAPTATVSIGTSTWESFLNTITFGLFFKDTQTITVTSVDSGAGVDKIYYKLSDTILDESEVGEITDWTEYTASFTVEPDNEYIVYVKIIDKTGNTAYISSDGLVLDGTAPVISGVENGKIYCEALDIKVTDANLDVVTVDGVPTALIDGTLTLSPTGKPQTVVATDKVGNSTTLSVTIYNGHAWDDGVVTSAPTVSEKGVKTYTCTHCGETKTEEIERLTPIIIEGQNNEWRPSKSSTLTFRSNASFKDFIRVLVNGKWIDAKHYTLKEGSIIVTLKADYLATLPAGTYTLGIQSVTGTASTEFTIAAKAGNTELPQTGDNSNMCLWIALLLVSSSALTVFGIKSRKRKAVK